MTEEQNPLEVLVADDEESIRFFLSSVIANKGVNVTTAVDGQEAIDIYLRRYEGESPIDLVFTDLSMPNKSGVDVVRAVKERSLKTPVYVITGEEPTEGYRQLEAQLGESKPDGVIGKPFGIDQITDIVEKVKLQKYSPVDSQNYQTPQS